MISAFRHTAITLAKSGALVLLAVIALLLLAGQALSGTFDHYPDLVADAPGGSHLEIDVWPVGDPVDPTDCLLLHQGDCRLLMQFDGFVTNIGEGPLHIEGNPQEIGGVSGQVAQWILDENGDPVLGEPIYYLDTDGESPAIKYQTNDDHDHFHLMDVMEYSLWDETRAQQVLESSKVGFCLYDVDMVVGFPDPPPQTYDGGGNFCQTGNPTADYLEMGTSQGWRDVYSFILDLQWIDVTELSPGNYLLAARADPLDRVVELDETNNGYEFGNAPAIVPGHVAQPFALDIDASLDFDLTVETYTTTIDEDPRDFVVPGSTPECPIGSNGLLCAQDNVSYPKGTLEYTLHTLPSHGTLTQGAIPVVVGSPITSSTLTYTPEVGYRGPDPFIYSAADSGSPVPIDGCSIHRFHLRVEHRT